MSSCRTCSKELKKGDFKAQIHEGIERGMYCDKCFKKTNEWRRLLRNARERNKK